MWVRSAAIRPVPPHAVLPREALELVEEWLGDDEWTTEQRLGELHELFEASQPALAARLAGALERSHDEVASALGYFLALTLFKAFDETFEGSLQTISSEALASVDEALALDEQLRGSDPDEAVDSEDVVAMEQPHVVAFVHEHLENALDVHAESADVDAVHAMYRTLLIFLLALSYAVTPPEGSTSLGDEMQA